MEYVFFLFKIEYFCDIWGFRSGLDEDLNLLGFDALAIDSLSIYITREAMYVTFRRVRVTIVPVEKQ
jgi:hypothetical protein